MPGVIYLPQRKTTWEQLFPLAMRMMFQRKMAQEQAQRQKELLGERQEFQSTEAEKQRQFQEQEFNKRIQAQLIRAGYIPMELGTGQEYAATWEEPAFKVAGKGWRRPEIKFGEVEPIKINGKVIGAGIPLLKNGQIVDYKFQTVPAVKMDVKDYTDEQGNVTRIISDPTTGQPVKEIKLGKMGKGTTSKIDLPAYGKDLASAIDAIKKGAPADEVAKRMFQAYPKQASQIKSILLDSAMLPDQVKNDLTIAFEQIKGGADPNRVYQALAVKYPRYRQTFRGILLTPMTLGSMDLSAIFNK